MLEKSGFKLAAFNLEFPHRSLMWSDVRVFSLSSLYNNH